MEAILTHQNDTVDLVSHRFYGTTVLTEKILNANAGLAEYGPILPAGLPIHMPVFEMQAGSPAHLNIWD